ncbi:MAG TPA: TIGR03619 family F420-dependent LLM class oxidoreductase [Actinocrinis sp.]|jgi:probable F420-dependent oxidoreductase
MQLGMFGLNCGQAFTAGATSVARYAQDQLAFDSVWAPEHVVLPSPRVAPSPMEPDEPILDPLVHLAHLAGAVGSMLLATGVIVLPQRNPLVLAKQAASLDRLCAGRLILGVGAGYLEPELAALGVPVTRRGAMTDDYIAAMRAVWSGSGPVEYHGKFADFGGVEANPRPVQPGGPRIVVGGRSPAAFRRAVAQGHGWYGYSLTPERTARCVQGLREAADAVGRPAELGELELTVTPADRLELPAVAAYAELGIRRLVVSVASLDMSTAMHTMEAARLVVDDVAA